MARNGVCGFHGVKMVVIMMTLLVAVHAEKYSPSSQPPSSPVSPDSNIGLCAANCALQCLMKGFGPLTIICFGVCMIKCKHSPSDGVYDCTSNCASNFNPEADQVEGFVDSCYNNCSSI